MVGENLSIELLFLKVLANLSQLPVLFIEILDLGWSVKDFLDILGNLLVGILGEVDDLGVRTEGSEL